MWRAAALFSALIILLCSCSQKPAAGPGPANTAATNLPSEVRAFIERKEQSLPILAKALGVKVDAQTLKFFAHAKKGDFAAAMELAHDLAERRGIVSSQRIDPNLRLPLWEPLFQVELAIEAYAKGVGKFGKSLGQEIAQSIPPGSIYFAGTDGGRGLVAAFVKPIDGDDFIMVGQNSFADGEYLSYLRATFGEKAYMPSNQDSHNCFEEYLADAKQRLEHDLQLPNEPRQLKPGEDVKIVEGKVQVAGQRAVMSINELMARMIIQRNTNRECYIEEGFPLERLSPHLRPHRLIMKVQRGPAEIIPEDVAEKDRTFWAEQQKPLIGDWLTSATTVKQVCEFAERVHLRKDLIEFHGDRAFVQSDYACIMLSKLRAAQAGLYAWWIAHASSQDEQRRMIREADFAFRQSFAFDPASPEVIFRYVNLLTQLSRLDDALLVARAAFKIMQSADRDECGRLVRELERIQQTQAR